MQVAEAVHYFGKAKRNNHGVRLAKQHGMDAELLDLALKACLCCIKQNETNNNIQTYAYHVYTYRVCMHVGNYTYRIS